MGVAKPRWDWLEETTSASELLDGRNATAADAPGAKGADDEADGSGAAPKSQRTPYPGVFGAELKKATSSAGDGEQRLPRLVRCVSPLPLTAHLSVRDQ